MISLQTGSVATAQLYFNKAMGGVVTYLPSAVGSILVLWLGFKVINKIIELVERILNKSTLSDTVRPFTISIVSVTLKVTVVLASAGIAGLNLDIFTTIIGASVLAIGLSLQGSLGNLASGLLVLSIKPYKVGDWIEVTEKFGKVTVIGIFNTTVVTPGNKTLIIPNSKMTSDVITNHSEYGVFRLEINVTIPYNESFPRVKKIIEETITAIPKVLKTPVPEIGIESFDSHSVHVIVRPYVKPDDYWEVTFSCYENIKNAFSKNNIKVAYSESVEFGNIGE